MASNNAANIPGILRLPQPLTEMDNSHPRSNSKPRSKRRPKMKPKIRTTNPTEQQQVQNTPNNDAATQPTTSSSQAQVLPNFRQQQSQGPPLQQPLPQAVISAPRPQRGVSHHQNNANAMILRHLQQGVGSSVGGGGSRGGGPGEHYHAGQNKMTPRPTDANNSSRLQGGGPGVGEHYHQHQPINKPAAVPPSSPFNMPQLGHSHRSAGQNKGSPGPSWRQNKTTPRPADANTSSRPQLQGGNGVGGPSSSASTNISQKKRPTFQKPERISYARVFYSMMDNPSLNARKEQVFANYANLPLKDQLEEMQLSLSLTQDAQEQRLKIMEHILMILRKEYPFCCLYPFGSYLTSLGDSTSDVDLYVDAFGVTVGQKLPKTACGTLDVLERCFRTLRRAKCPTSFKALCRQVVPIREARVPILKITHWSNVNLDLSFENLTSLKNSEMIDLYIKLDPCVRPLMVLIRFWGRFHCLTGSNCIKNYCLVLMVLVFLTSKKIVPSVEVLQQLRKLEVEPPASSKSKNKDKDNKEIIDNSDIIDGWDTGVPKLETIHRHIFSPSNSIADRDFGGDLTKAVLSLAKDFFIMFGNVDFSTSVICTKTAQILPLQLFKPGNEEDLPDSLEKYKDWAVQQPLSKRLNIRNPLCVQDPFILSYNVGAVTPFTTLFKFQVACRETAGILENVDQLESLLQLFIPLPKEVGDRRFLNLQERQRETFKLKDDINHFMERGEFPLLLADEMTNPNSEESLGLHRLPLEEIINRNSIRFGKGWESLSLLVPSEDFQNLFADTVVRHKLHQENSTRFLFEKLKQLWLSFVGDFLEDFWENCFSLQVNKEEREIARRIFHADPPLFGTRWNRRNYEALFTERNRRRNRNTNNNQQQQNASPTSSSNSIDPEDCAILDKKLLDLGDIHEKISCMRLACSTSVPVWQRRMKIYNEIINHLNPSTEGGNDDKAASSSKSRSPRKKKPIILNAVDDINPLEIQTRVTQIIKDEFQKEKKPVKPPLLAFAVFIKIDSSLVDDIPSMSIVCEKLKDTQQNIYNQGVSTLVETLNDVFETYCIYRLKDWINLSKGRKHGDGNLSSSSSSSDLFENGTAEDFDSLMPPSSSSECSSPINEFSPYVVTGEWEDEK